MSTCLNCKISTNNPKFCSRQCAAKVNNRLNPKRKPITRKCKCCDALAITQRRYCPEHIGAAQRARIRRNKRTLGEIMSRQGKVHPSWVRSYIRRFSRTDYLNSGRPKCCEKCGYSKHFEVCHIKPLKTFPLTATIEEVNALSNLVALCPNCHWEFDNSHMGVSRPRFMATSGRSGEAECIPPPKA